MKQWYIILLLSVSGFAIGWLWQMNVPPLPDQFIETSNIGWQSVTKDQDQYRRQVMDGTTSGEYISYRSSTLALYGRGNIPTLSDHHITVSDGQWFIRVQDTAEIIITTSMRTLAAQGPGSLYVDTVSGDVINFDAGVTLGETTLPPLFIDRQGERELVDMMNMDGMIAPDLWDMYRSLAAYDIQYHAIDATELGADIDTWIDREPTNTDQSDTSIRSLLNDIKNTLSNITKNIPCGLSVDECYARIDTLVKNGQSKDPSIFDDLALKVASWKNASSNRTNATWQDIFHTYHRGILVGDARARTQRDKSVLAWLASQKVPATLDVWQYLSALFAHEKLGSVYSIRLMSEMIRIGESLTTQADPAPIITQSQTALIQLHALFESTYFTKRDQFYVLKSDLTNEHGESFDGKNLAADLRTLINQVDNSQLFNTLSEFDTIRGQLVWFTCIFEKNEDYLRDARTCRARRTR